MDNYETFFEQSFFSDKKNIYAVKIIGSVHQKINLPCQDYVKIWHDRKLNNHILALADGHGDSRYYYSDLGSKFITESAIETIKSYSNLFGQRSVLLNSLKNNFPGQILKKWKSKVKKDFSTKNKLNFNNEAVYYKRYGTTILVSLILDNEIYLCQLGDGDIIIIDSDFELYTPFPEYNTLVSNETYSIISENSLNLWKITPFTIPKDSLLIMCSDGLTNSFESPEFHKFCKSIYKNIIKFGFHKTIKVIPKWLENATNYGSGDDISLIISTLKFMV